MGLLDDAIREHMELKRRRGADPGEVAREEQDALAPVRREEAAESPASRDSVDSPEETSPEDATLGDAFSRDPQPARAPDFANVGQETAELDMRTVLGEEHDSQEPAVPTRTAAGPAGSAEHPGDLLEDTPEQERLWFEQQPPRDFDLDR